MNPAAMIPRSPQQNYYAALIPQLVRPYRNCAWEFTGFNERMNELLGAADDYELQEAAPHHLGFVPDAFFVDDKKRMVFALEIVESNDITELKANNISNAFWLLDAAYWQLAVVLFYPKYARTMLAWDLMFLDGLADSFEGRRNPYRDAFTAIRRDVNDSDDSEPPTKEEVHGALAKLEEAFHKVAA